MRLYTIACVSIGGWGYPVIYGRFAQMLLNMGFIWVKTWVKSKLLTLEASYINKYWGEYDSRRLQLKVNNNI